MPLTDTDRTLLREVDARERAATALMGDGWEYDEDSLMVFFSAGYVNTRQPIAALRGGDFLMQYSGDTLDKVLPQLHANGRFIASARTDIPRLREIIDRLAGEQEPAKCKYCSESSPYLAVIEAADPRVFVSVSGAYLQVFDEEYPGFVDNIPICYCPKCGRKLTDRKEPDDGTD
jgi:hypothetical protein